MDNGSYGYDGRKVHSHRKDGVISGKQQETMEFMSIISSHGRLRQDFKAKASLGYMLNSKSPTWKEKERKGRREGKGREGKDERGEGKKETERRSRGGRGKKWEKRKGKRDESKDKERRKKRQDGEREGKRNIETRKEQGIEGQCFCGTRRKRHDSLLPMP